MKKAWKRALPLVVMGTVMIPFSVKASEEEENLLAFMNDTLEDGSLTYEFEEVGITLPADWKGKVRISIKDNEAIFYHNASREKWIEEYGCDGGKLFTLGYSVNKDFSNYDEISYIGFSEETMMNYFLILPTDLQGYMETSIMDEFYQLSSGVEFVKKNAHMLEAGTE